MKKFSEFVNEIKYVNSTKELEAMKPGESRSHRFEGEEWEIIKSPNGDGTYKVYVSDKVKPVVYRDLETLMVDFKDLGIHRL